LASVRCNLAAVELLLVGHSHGERHAGAMPDPGRRRKHLTAPAEAPFRGRENPLVCVVRLRLLDMGAQNAVWTTA
jgi:hypothetical protein